MHNLTLPSNLNGLVENLGRDHHKTMELMRSDKLKLNPDKIELLLEKLILLWEVGLSFVLDGGSCLKLGRAEETWGGGITGPWQFKRGPWATRLPN